MLIGVFKENNYEIVNQVEEAEVIVVNTCGFIKSAKEEAINTIIEMGEYKKTGNCKYLIVMGCLVERYKKELKESMPEVDLFLKISEYELKLSPTSLVYVAPALSIKHSTRLID